MPYPYRPPVNIDTDSEAKFNMAIATLQRVDKIFEEIKRVSSMAIGIPGITMGQVQRLKLTVMWQLFIQSIPLMDDTKLEENEKIEDIKARLDKIVIKRKEIRSKRGGEVLRYEDLYDVNVEKELNNIEIDIQIALQKSGKYFRLPKSESALF